MEKGVKKYGWGWEGKVIEVFIENNELWVTVDYGYAWTIKEFEVLSWPKGPWGPAGSLNVEEYQKLYKEVID